MSQRDPLSARGRAELLQFKVKKQTRCILGSVFLAVPTRKSPMAATGILWEDGDGWQSLTSRLQEPGIWDCREVLCPSIALGKAG